MPGNLIHSCGRYSAPPGSTLAALIARIEALLVLDAELRDTGHPINKEDGLYEAEVLTGIAVWKILYEPDHGFSRDMQLLFQITLDSSVPTSMASLEMVGAVGELGPWVEDRARSVDDCGTWIMLLRDHLKTYRGNTEGFFSECRLAFPDFVFSNRFPDCFGTFKGDLSNFIEVIVSALVSLARDMPECMTQPTTQACMRVFSVMAGFETSMEGNAGRKDALTFRFAGKDGFLQILCEPHIKLHRSARAGDTEYYFHRIYFSTAGHAEFEGKTLIGHIGEHL
jgi:hypothetical protein